MLKIGYLWIVVQVLVEKHRGVPTCIKLSVNMPKITNFSTKYFILSKVYTDKGGIK